MSAAYDYLNAKARALKGRLLPSVRFRELARMETVATLIDVLAATTPYAADLEKAPSLLRGVTTCEQAFAHRLSHFFHGFWRDAGEDIRHWLEAWWAPWDLTVIKILLRALKERPPVQEMDLDRVPVATWSREDLAQTASLSELADRLKRRGDLGRALAGVLRSKGEARLPDLEDALDLAWAEHAVSLAGRNGNEGRIFAHFLAWEMDRRNLLTALRMARDGGEGECPFLPGGRHVTRELSKRIAGRTGLDQALVLLEGTPFFEAVRAEAPPFEPERALARVERRLGGLVLERSGSIYRRGDPLGLGVLLYLTQLLANEVRNLRILAHGIDHRLPAGLIEEELVLV